MTELTKQVPGPILILGAGGFLGNRCLRRFLQCRSDVLGVYRRSSPRLDGIPETALCSTTQLESRWEFLWNEGGFRTVLDFAAVGAAGGGDADDLFEMNALRVRRLTEDLKRRPNVRYLLAGSSSEYGFACDHPSESQKTAPNSAYAVSKAWASSLLEFRGRHEGLSCAVLRPFSVYGPGEASHRLIPTLVREARDGRWPPLASADAAHDFIHVDDVLAAFETLAVHLKPEDHGSAFNVGTGRQTTLAELANVTRELWNLKGDPPFGSYPSRTWDQKIWVADIARLRSYDWEPKIDLHQGLRDLELRDAPTLEGSRRKLTVVAALYKDAPGLRDLAAEVGAAFETADVDGELILVNDASPDQTEDMIRELTAKHSWIRGITHTRNFGSQAAFVSGMAVATGDAVILMDGDLQDPPALIPDLVREWKNGSAMVLARRRRRQMSRTREFIYKCAYRLWSLTSDHPIPADVGDFSLMERPLFERLVAGATPESILRAERAQLGGPVGWIDYVRPERRYGRSTGSWKALARWALRSFSGTGGRALEFMIASQFLALLAWIATGFGRDLSVTASILTTTLVVGIILCEIFVLRIWRQSLNRPLFVRRHRIQNGRVTPW